MAIFPGAVATDTNLYIAVNDLATALTGSLTTGTTSIPVTSTTGFPASGFISIDSEIMHYSAIADSTHFTVDVRGADGTTAATHTSTTAVYHNVIAAHHNALKDEIEAIEGHLSTVIGRNTAYIIAPASVSSAPTIRVSNNCGLYDIGAGTMGISDGTNRYAFFGSVQSGLETGSGSVTFILNGTAGTTSLNNSPLKITNTSNQLILGGGNNVTITAPAPATTSRTVTIPDLSGDYSVVGTIGSQTIAGTKTFSAAPVISALTASTIPYLDASKVLTSSAVTPTELGYLSGVTSAIQTQLGTKAPIASPTFTGTVAGLQNNTNGTTTLFVANDDNTSDATIARFTIETGGASAGDPVIRFYNNVTNWSTGLDNSDSDSWKVSNNIALGTSDAIIAKTGGGGVSILGTNTNDSASAGFVGEYVTSAVTSNTNFPTSTQYGDLTSITLTAGDWDIWVFGSPQENGGTTTNVEVGFSSTSGNSSTGLTRGNTSCIYAIGTPNFPPVFIQGRVSISGSTTYYFKYFATYTSTAPVMRGTISARRRR
jgi:hypothetical protein